MHPTHATAAIPTTGHTTLNRCRAASTPIHHPTSTGEVKYSILPTPKYNTDRPSRRPTNGVAFAGKKILQPDHKIKHATK
jgi:hypothetical protein